MKLERLGRRLAGAVVTRRRLTIALALLVTAAAAAGLARARFSTDYRIFFAFSLKGLGRSREGSW